MEPVTKTESRQHRFIIDAVMLGVVGALAAQAFGLLLRAAEQVFLVWLAGYHAPELPNEGGALEETVGAYGLWLIPLACALGGLIAGVLVYSLAPEAEGHGTDTVVKSFHREGGGIRFRVSPLKMIASAITIGSGGSAGREGPTALIAAGIGSTYATLTHRPDQDRRTLVLVGMAAGLAAIFRSPIGAAIFAVEVLYATMEFEVGVLLYALLASVVAYSVNGFFSGWQPLFRYPETNLTIELSDHLWYALLGLVAGLVATVLPIVFYRVRDGFRRIPWPNQFKPAIGGLAVGVMALAWPQVLGGGYGWIQEAIDGKIATATMLTLLGAKMVALSLTIGSGGSGGVFAPSLFIGAMLGGSLANLSGLPPAPFVVVGMAAVFAGAARVPMATLLMVTEMTGGYSLLVPAALAVVISTLLQSLLASRLKYCSLYEAQVPTRADSPAHRVEHLQIALDLLAQRKVPVSATLKHVDLVKLLESGVPLDLPGGRQLGIGVLRLGSGAAGLPLDSISVTDANGEMEIIAVLRDDEMMLPSPNVALQSGDRILAIGTATKWEEVKERLKSPSGT